MIFTKNLITELHFSNLVYRSAKDDFNGEFFFQICNCAKRPIAKIVDTRGKDSQRIKRGISNRELMNNK